MNKLTTALAVGAVLALSVMTAPMALAQDDTRDCNRAQREVTRIELRLAAGITEERDAEKAARDAARAALDQAQAAATSAGSPGGTDITPVERGLIRDARAVLDRRQAELDTDSRRLLDLRADLVRVVQEREDACDTPPTTTPPPTSTVTTTPPVADDDVDCDEVTDARAQEILNSDRSDPHNLDDDNDGVACEEDVVLRPDVVVVPNGGVNTGGGPA